MPKASKPYPMFEAYCLAHGLIDPEREVRFHPKRRWRFDFAWSAKLVALEIDGGIWTSGRHTRGAGFFKDMEKLNEAVLAGWRVLRCSPEQMENGHIFTLLARIL